MAVTELRDHQARENLKIELPALKDLRINDATPFCSHNDGAEERLAEAHAILTIMQGAHEVCEAASEEAADAFDSIRGTIKGRAIEGVATLIALAQYHLDCAQAERRAVHG